VLNGRVLQRGTDYLVDYDLGKFTWLIDEALDPAVSLTIIKLTG
jgi:hypothetical protein